MIVVPNTKESNGALNQLVAVLRGFANYLSTVFDTGGRLRVNVEVGGTVTTMTNQTQMGGVPANDQIPALLSMNAYNLRDRITVQ